MDCKTAGMLLHPYFDGELDEGTAANVKSHIAGCAACRQELASLQALREAVQRAVPRYQAPPELYQRLAGSTPGSAERPARLLGVERNAVRWLAFAASLVLVAVLSATVTRTFLPPAGDGGSQALLLRDLVSSHLRALAAPSSVDVESSDRHTVKPWFAGRVEVAPPAVDLTQQGFVLVGGRVDYVGERRVAVLVYRHAQHLIDVFVLPGGDTEGPAPNSLTRQGFNLVHRRFAGIAIWAVSDLDADELIHFADLMAATH